MVLATSPRLSCPKCLRCPSARKGNIGEQGQLSALGSNQRQSHVMSLVEAITNVVVGYLLALATQFAIFPLFGIAVSVTDNLVIGCIFTAISLVRSYILRRIFERSSQARTQR